MPDLKRVIKGLECRLSNAGDENMTYCPDCTYYFTSNCEGTLNRDALELLKAQEPRVLTLEEARTYEVVWPEDKGEGELHPLIVENNMNDSKYYKYGIHWRVWSAKPTDEQRKAVKWDEPQ